ncbi:MAG: alanine--tRNA ligase [Chloroflexi bacterium]|nr:alanine--tRNA ligase [Chloroflexota bacterium]
MVKMTIDELRDLYLAFFQGKGHLVVPSSSLVPVGDPTLLLTSAGMVQFKPYFTGEAVPPSPRLASCQKCFRTTDIDSVGDSKHLSFFEMLGNFSIGDYFKKEAIEWAWEFVTQVLKIPPESLWVTYYKEGDQEDLEARGYWLEATKGRLSESRIVPLGAKYNWWGPAGEEGPCGPCSEIHYSFDPEHTTIADLTGDSPRTVEIWNLVFTQFYHHRDGRRTPLPRPNIDTGMGLERTAVVLQGKRTVYEIDAFDYLIKRVEELSGRRYGQDEEADHAMRVLAEHARGVAFLIADGVTPSHEGRGYVLRRILRRAVRFGCKVGIKELFLTKLAEVVIERMGGIYPELVQSREFILKAVELEERRFGETLDTGLWFLEESIRLRNSIAKPVVQNIRNSVATEANNIIRLAGKVDTYVGDFERAARIGNASAQTLAGEMAVNAIMSKMNELTSRLWQMAQSSAPVPTPVPQPEVDGLVARVEQKVTGVSGDEVFLLYDTFGFPAELTDEIAREHGLSVDMEGFEREMERQRERARAAHKFGLHQEGKLTKAEVYEKLGLGSTRFTGYERLVEKSVVVGILVGEEPVARATAGEEAQVFLRETPFYAEMGGQVGDTGEIKAPNGSLTVVDTQVPVPGLIVHRGKVAGEISVGDPVEAQVDVERRMDIARNHTATHLLHAALRKVLGTHLRQGGSLVSPDRFRFDFSHPVALSREELGEVQRLVNGKIMENLPVRKRELPYDKAIAEGAIAFFGEKYGRMVRVVDVAEFSKELCGGTHLSATGEIGYFRIVSEQSIGSGLRRIEALTGRGAEALVEDHFDTLQSVAHTLKTSYGDLRGRVENLLEEMEKERKRALSLERELSRTVADSLITQTESVNGITVLSAKVQASSIETLREMGDRIKDRLGSGVIVLGAIVGEKPAFVAMVTPDLVAKGLHAGEISKGVAAVVGGGGGGRPEIAQAGGKDREKLDEALRSVKSLVKKRH